MSINKFLNTVSKRMKELLFTSIWDKNTRVSLMLDGTACDGLLSGKTFQKLAQVVKV